MQELSEKVHTALASQNIGHGLPDYWASRIDETASDVLGVLNLGPAAAIGLIGYFRGIRAAISGDARLQNNGSSNDPHPADILRGYLARTPPPCSSSMIPLPGHKSLNPKQIRIYRPSA